MAVYGLTAEGFVPQTLSVIRESINTVMRNTFGASIDVSNLSIMGQIIGIVAERLALLWELSEAVNSSQDPDKATGAALEALCLLTGTFRPAATYSTVTLTLTGTPATAVPALSAVRTNSTEIEFKTDSLATITALTAWVVSTPYVVGDRRTANAQVFRCTIAGTSTSSGTGPMVIPSEIEAALNGFITITDGTITWEYLGEGTGAIDVTALATTTGPVVAATKDLRVIVNSVSGWESVLNLADADPGRSVATDSELRLLRELELAHGGSTPVNALRAELLDVVDVVAVTIFQNVTDVTDADGIPPHSIEALVRGPDSPDVAFDQSIFDALLAGVAAGIRTFGNVTGGVFGTATDDQLTVHAMAFTRPTNVPIYVAISVTKDPNTYPADGDDQIKLAIDAYGDAQNTGKDAVSSRIAAAAFTVPGVLDVTSCFIGTAPGPTLSTTIAISLRELATFSTLNVAVTAIDGVP